MVSDIELTGYTPTTRHRLASAALVDAIGAHLPDRLRLRTEWRLKYSLEQHGSSLTTLYDQSAKDSRDHQQRGYVIIVRDAKNGVFGAYSSVELKPVAHMKWQGNGDCFLWKQTSKSSLRGTADVGLAAYNYTGKNDYLVFCHPQYLSFGSGDGHPGLWIDQALDQGRSLPSETYDNAVLSTQGEKFDIIGVEVWEI